MNLLVFLCGFYSQKVCIAQAISTNKNRISSAENFKILSYYSLNDRVDYFYILLHRASLRGIIFLKSNICIYYSSIGLGFFILYGNTSFSGNHWKIACIVLKKNLVSDRKIQKTFT